MITLYGITNCDTVRKARRWLTDHGIDYRFHDFRKDGIDKDEVLRWVEALGWEVLINKRGLTWKRLDETTRQQINEDSAIRLMLESPTIIKRPVLDLVGKYVVGFKPENYANLFPGD
ncbi:MAG: ArsC family reductase [bacterium]